MCSVAKIACVDMGLLQKTSFGDQRVDVPGHVFFPGRQHFATTTVCTISVIMEQRSAPTHQKVALREMHTWYSGSMCSGPSCNINVLDADSHQNVWAKKSKFRLHAPERHRIKVFEKMPYNFLMQGIRFQIVAIDV